MLAPASTAPPTTLIQPIPLLSPTAPTFLAGDNNNNWWLSAWDGGLARVKSLNPANNWSYDKSVEVFKHDKNNPNSISSNTVTGLLHDSQDRLWAATWSQEINFIENVSTSNQPKFKRLKVGGNAYVVFE